MSDTNTILSVILIVLIFIGILNTIITVILMQFAIEARKEFKEYQLTATQEAIFKDFFDKQHLAFHLKNFDKG